MGLFIKKPLEALQAEANQTGSKSLKRVLGPWSLVALGVGVIIGAGLFVHNRNQSPPDIQDRPLHFHSPLPQSDVALPDFVMQSLLR